MAEYARIGWLKKGGGAEEKAVMAVFRYGKTSAHFVRGKDRSEEYGGIGGNGSKSGRV
jgi:hypothetical protein